jgi:hypothetical protein
LAFAFEAWDRLHKRFQRLNLKRWVNKK